MSLVSLLSLCLLCCYTIGHLYKCIDNNRYSVMKGYWGNEQQTKESIVDGWMKTGDIGIMDERGYCKIVGRHKVQKPTTMTIGTTVRWCLLVLLVLLALLVLLCWNLP